MLLYVMQVTLNTFENIQTKPPLALISFQNNVNIVSKNVTLRGVQSIVTQATPYLARTVAYLPIEQAQRDAENQPQAQQPSGGTQRD